MLFVKCINQDYNGFKYGVVDTDDGIMEYYTAKDLLRIAMEIKIKGVDLKTGSVNVYSILPLVQRRVDKYKLAGVLPLDCWITMSDIYNLVSLSYAIGSSHKKVGRLVKIPLGVDDIVGSSFADCLALEEVVFSSTMRHIGSHAFYRCSSLRKIDLPNNLTAIYQYAFAKCVSLSNIKLTGKVKL